MPSIHDRMSKSWQHLVRIMGPDVDLLDQLPRMKLWAMCQ